MTIICLTVQRNINWGRSKWIRCAIPGAYFFSTTQIKGRRTSWLAPTGPELCGQLRYPQLARPAIGTSTPGTRAVVENSTRTASGRGGSIIQENPVKRKMGRTAKPGKYLEPLKSPRPRKADAGIVFSLRLSSQELENLRDSAERENLTVSDLIRRRMFPPASPSLIFGGPQATTTTTSSRRVARWKDSESTQNSAHR